MPDDGQVYRVQCAGRVSQDASDGSASVEIFLQRQQPTNVGYQASAAVKDQKGISRNPVIEMIRESAGVVPSFWIGSLWKDGKLLDDQRYPGTVVKEFDIQFGSEWDIVAANDRTNKATLSGKAAYLVPPFQYPLRGWSVSGDEHAFFDAPLVRCTDASGATVLIPCFEIFRRYYGVSSTLANVMLSRHWKFALDELIHADLSGPQTEKIVIAPKGRLDNLSCCVIANLLATSKGTAAAASIYAEIENQKSRKFGKHWIRATPPFFTGRFRVKGTAKQLGAGGPFLLLNIVRSTFPELSHPLEKYITEELIRLPANAELGDQLAAPESTIIRDFDSEIAIARSDTVSAKRQNYYSVATGDAWEDLPVVTEAVGVYVVRRGPSAKGSDDDQVIADTSPLTVKEPNEVDSRRKAKRIAVTTSENQVLVSRFAMLETALKHLSRPTPVPTTKGRATSVDSWRSVSFGLTKTLSFGTVSAFPVDVASCTPEWGCLTEGDKTRARYAWIVELVFEGKPTYLIEIEACRNETFRMLFFECSADSTHLDLAISKLLNIALDEEGKWPNQYGDALLALVNLRVRRHHFDRGNTTHPMVCPKSIIATIVDLRKSG